jgi:hypothetical protein
VSATLDAAGLLARLPRTEPRGIFPGRPEEAAPDVVAAAFLARLDSADRAILVLVLGLGLDLGTVASALRLDPSIVSWRLRRSLLNGVPGQDAGVLERGVMHMLRERRPEELLAELPEGARERLAARVDSDDGHVTDRERRPGLGIGSLVLILVSAAGFMVYGAIRDVNPLWRGMSQIRLGDYPRARDAFLELGPLPQARAWTAITWLADGEFERALDVLAEPGAANYLGEFRPMDVPLQQTGADRRSAALLPRGLIADGRPDFVYLPGAATTLVLEVEPGGKDMRQKRYALPAAPPDTEVARLEYPAEWPELVEGLVLWDVQGAEPGADVEPTGFTVLEKGARRELQQRAAARLTHEIPLAAREFLRAHFDLRQGLYMQAGQRFARLAREFPAEDYPRRMLAEVAAALGVAPDVFLR